MNKGNINLITLVFTFLIISISFSSCSTLTASPKPSENVEANKDQGLSQNETARGKEARSGSANNVNQNREILWDFRKPDISDSQKFSKAETKAVVKYLFGDQANQNLEITSRVSGSFTKLNAKETLYFLSGCKDEETEKFTTDCPHVSWNTDGWIAIYDGTTPIMKINEALGGGIVKVTDVNGDGINEILNFGGYGGMGISTTFANLGQISGNKYEIIKSFNGDYDNCADNTAEKPSSVASVISYIPTTNSKMPIFSIDYFQNGCKDNSSWKKITKKQFDVFFDENS